MLQVFYWIGIIGIVVSIVLQLRRSSQCQCSYEENETNKRPIQKSARRDDLEEKLAIAIENNGFYLCYQPQVQMHTYRVVGFEALMRWEQPDGVLIPPDIFIGIAEKTGGIITLGKWMMEESIRFIQNYNKQVEEPKYIAMNISVIQLLQDTFLQDLRVLLDTYQVPYEWVTLEVTETVLVEKMEKIQDTLEAIKKCGIRVSIDDFGKGYANLNYIQDLPMDEVKIDKGFVDGIDKRYTSQVILETIVKMCEQLNVNSLAEGVETLKQLKYLEAIGCTYGQGYLFSKPVKEEVLKEVVCTIEERNWQEELKQV